MIRFVEASLEGGEGAQLEAAMREEMRVLYAGLDLHGPDMPKAGPAELGPPSGAFIVGYEQDLAVCCGGVKRLDAEACEIKRMYVIPPARGRGVAWELLAALEDRARALGYGIARLDTGPKQQSAQRMYERAGYLPIANFNANPMATFFGEKRL